MKGLFSGDMMRLASVGVPAIPRGTATSVVAWTVLNVLESIQMKLTKSVMRLPTRNMVMWLVGFHA